MIKLLITLNLIILSHICLAKSNDINCRTVDLNWTKEFNHSYIKDEFIIFYSDLPYSSHSVTQIQDLNKNNIPDYVENIAIQAVSSRDAFKLGGLKHPLQSDRYNKNATKISIFIKKLNGNGLAFESSSQYSYLSKTQSMPCSLIIFISNNLNNFPGNYWTTVTHELFHLYEYGYAQFKNSWYLESLANWSERALKKDPEDPKQTIALPQNKVKLDSQILRNPYNQLWHRLFILNQDDRLIFSPDIMQRKYVNGSDVFKDNQWRGINFVSKFLEDLKHSSSTISKQKNWSEYQWASDIKKDTQWDPIILSIIQKQLKKTPYKNMPEASFLRTIKLNDLYLGEK